MTVAELIMELQKTNPRATVTLFDDRDDIWRDVVSVVTNREEVRICHMWTSSTKFPELHN